MKILVFSQYWSPENNVPQRRWLWLTELLVKAGHEVLVVAPPPHFERKIPFGDWLRSLRKNRARKNGPSVEEGPSGERILRTGFFPADNSLTGKVINQASVAVGMLFGVFVYRGKVNEFRPDLCIGTVPAIPTSAVTFLASKVLRIPYIIDLRDAWPDLLEQSGQWNEGLGKRSLKEVILSKGPLQLVRVIVRNVLNNVLENASAIVVTSECLQERLTTNLKNGKRKTITTVRNVFPPSSSIEKIRTADAPLAGLNVLYAGTLGRAQHLKNAIDAACLAQEGGLKIKLCFVGTGAAKRELRTYAKDSGVDAIFENRREPHEIGAFYEWADTVLVHLTDWEPLQRAVPSKTYELMELGKHISGVLAGEASFLVREMEAGHVVTPEAPEELARLWLEIAQRPEMLQVSEKARRWVLDQRQKIVPQRLEDVLNEAVAD